MASELPEFLRENQGQIEFVGTRLAIADVAHLYDKGYSVETVALQFPSLPLSTLHRFIAF